MSQLSKAKTKEVAAQAIAQVTKELMTEIEAEHQAAGDGKHDMVNADGGILRAKLTLQPRDKAPNPLSVVINEEIYWIPRGVEVEVPWYVVQSLKNNVERKFKREKDSQGKNIVTPYDALAEPFSYRPINPTPDCRL